MVGAMLVGAWLLIHQQCCVTGEMDSRLRSPLVDPLTRRSALEKNFMRFGRSSWNPNEEMGTRDRTKDNFMRFGRAKPENFFRFGKSDAVDQLLRPARSKENFMRFGRDPNEDSCPDEEQDLNSSSPHYDHENDFLRFVRAKDNFMRFGRNNNFMRFGRAKDNFMRFGRTKDNFMRFGRSKDNFMRFGRGKDNFLRFGKSKNNFMRFGRSKDNFMRFGRPKENFMRFGRDGKEAEEETQRFQRSVDDNFVRSIRDKALIRLGRQRQAEKGDGFIRFGRSLEEQSQEDKEKIMKNSEDNQDIKCKDEKCDVVKLETDYHPCAEQIDPNVIMAPEFSLLPHLPSKVTLSTSPSRNFMRLG